MRGDLAQRALIERIRASVNTLEVFFAPARPVGTAGPVTRPASPATGVKPTVTLVATAPVGELEPLELKCLWLDAPVQQRSVGGITRVEAGWVDTADALARVIWCEAMVDEDSPEKGSWFDKAEYVLARGLRWRVIKTEPMGASFRLPHTLSVWLAGAAKQR
jgi:hypothetical protein